MKSENAFDQYTVVFFLFSDLQEKKGSNSFMVRAKKRKKKKRIVNSNRKVIEV